MVYQGMSFTKTVSVGHPVRSIRVLCGSCVGIKLIDHDIGAIHDVECPECWLLDEELVDIDIADIPENEWHGPANSDFTCFSCVPGVTVAFDTTSTKAIDCDVVASEDEVGSMILERNVVGVAISPPVVNVRRHGPDATPVNADIIDDWVHLAGNEVVLVLGKDDVASITTLVERLEDVVHIADIAAMSVDGTAFPWSIVVDTDPASAKRRRDSTRQ